MHERINEWMNERRNEWKIFELKKEWMKNE